MKRVYIDYLPPSVHRYGNDVAIVAVDVFRATTSVVTCVSAGRRCFMVPTPEQARDRARSLEHPLLLGESAGSVPEGFDMDNSPSAIAGRADVTRPAVICSSSGAPLVAEAAQHPHVYAAALRNLSAQVAYLCEVHEEVAVIGAGTRGEFRPEDQAGCAWIAGLLVERGYKCEDEEAKELIAYWQSTPLDAILESKSVVWLEQTGRQADIDFVMQHVDDLDFVVKLHDDEFRRTP